MHRRHFGLALAALGASGPVRGWAQAQLKEIVASIRREGLDRSQIMRTMHVLSDIYGPRLTASPNAKAAGQWAAKQMAGWGLSNAHLEPWDFGFPGWTNTSATGFIQSPVRQQLYFAPAAWTPSTRGAISAEAVLIEPPAEANRDALATYLASLKTRVSGRIVLVGAATPARVDADASLQRFDERAIASYLHPEPYVPSPPPSPGQLTTRERNRLLDQFLVDAGALLRVRDSQRSFGGLQAFANYTYDLAKAPPTAGLRNEDYCRIARLFADGAPVRLEFDIQNRVHPEGRTAFNVVAEIPGTDKADEVVILGAHLDSWHLATGATDDAVGCAIMMEAARILMAVRANPRRTVRVVLWTGEEQGLYGSQAYVAEHFGTAEAPKAAFSKLNAYLNIDGGTGRVRVANVFGPEANAEVLHTILRPLNDLGVAGAVAHGVRRLRSTDSTTFSRAGLPAVGLSQDPTDNESAWHSNLDTYERILPEDAKQAAVVAATLAYGLATRDDMLLRFPPGEMPAPEGPPPDPHAASHG